jgi:hypothetical protein
MTTSEQINEIAKAGAMAQLELKPAIKDSVNPAFRSKYADYASIREASKVYAKHGIAIWQDVTLCELGVSVVTRLTHTSGQWIEMGPMTVPVGKHDAHGVGSATTYAKRYGLATALGIAADEDDDGNAAAAPQKTFDEVGYQEWLTNLETSAKTSTYAELLSTVKAGKQDFQDALRADKKTWLKLKALTEVPA